MGNTTDMFSKKFSQAESQTWDDFLKMQAELFAESEIDVLEKFGLSSKLSPLLDLGCGSGHFTFELNKRFNNMVFYCSDVNTHLLNKLSKQIKDRNTDNIETIPWSAGDEKMPDQLKGVKSVVMRMLLQHTLDPVQVLKSLKNELSNNTDIFIIEDDLSFYEVDPPSESFKKIINIIDNYCTSQKSNVYIGKQVPRLAIKAGLDVIKTEILFHNNINLGSDRLMNFFRWSTLLVAKTSPEIISEHEALQLIGELDDFVNTNKQSCFFNHALVITHART